MRLTNDERFIIKKAIRYYDSTAKIYLFGSRVDDSKKGGDIDLLIESENITRSDIRKIKIYIYDILGEQKIDIVLANENNEAFVNMAKKTGILL